MKKQLQFLVEVADKSGLQQFYELVRQNTFHKVYLYSGNFLMLSDRRRSYVFSFLEITYLEASGNYTHIYTEQKNKFTFSYSIKKISEKLPKEIFMRVHKSFVVNICQIRSLDDKSLTLKTNAQIPLSRNRKKEITDIFFPVE